MVPPQEDIFIAEAPRLKAPAIREAFCNQHRSHGRMWKPAEEMQGHPLKDIPWSLLKALDQCWHTGIHLGQLLCSIPHRRDQTILDGIESRLVLRGIFDGRSPV